MDRRLVFWIDLFTAFIAGALLWVLLHPRAEAAEPLRFEAQMGRCKQGLTPDGAWWSSSYPTDIDRTPQCYSLGLSQMPWKHNNTALGWRVAYVDLGKVKADNQFTYLEPQQPGVSGENCDSTTLQGCRGRAGITQKTQGISFGPVAEWSWGDLTLGIEGGGYYYYGVFETTVTSTPDVTKVNPVHYKWGSRHLTGYFGATARYEYLFSTFRTYSRVFADEEGHGNFTGLANGRAWQATIGVQVPF